MAVKLASDEYLRLKAEVNKQAGIARKRVLRLEEKGWTDSPAYQKLMNDGYIDKNTGRVKFSVRGKTYNELEKEYARLMEYNNSATSSIKGFEKTLKETAENTGIKYNDIEDLKSKVTQFFKLSDDISKYLDKVEGSAAAIGYQKIWQAINQYVADNKIDLSDTNLDIEKLSETIGELTTYQLVAQGFEGYGDGTDFEYF